MSEPPTDRELAFVATTKGVLVELAADQADVRLEGTFRGLRRRRIGGAVLLAAVLAGTTIASLVTYWIVARPETPMAFDGPLERGTPEAGAGAPAINRDGQGRVTEIATTHDGKPEGERVLFRAGRVVRIEHWSSGRLHGVATDFDGTGRVTRIETWQDGKLAGPELDLDAELRPRPPGSPP